MSHDLYAAAIPQVLAAFGLGADGESKAVAGGTLNWNFRVETSAGAWFVRRCRDDLETERIEGEHALVRWVASRGVPAPLPLRTPDGSTLVEFEHGRWAVFPWVEGEVCPRGTLSAARARVLGSCHGRVQRVLADHPDSANAQLPGRWSKEESLRILNRIIHVAAEKQAEDWILAGLRRQLAMLEALDVLPPQAFDSLPLQLLHGDFHDQQVLWRGDEISAVVDWEIWHAEPRVWEVVRSLSFSLLLDDTNLQDYLGGYREHVQLSPNEVSLGLQLWWQSRVVGLWAWAAYFLQGNERVKAFFPEMIAELDRVADESWRESVKERFIRAACA